jgi:chemosensory pili system protein ChpA (sensor histidine kinase/response regulator)
MAISGPRAKGALILCVDDDEDGRQACARCLVLDGYGVLEACDGEEALLLATTYLPQLVLLDLLLPKMDGWEVALRLRADPRTADVPILALSASVFPAHRARALAVGCNGFLEKPAEPHVIRSAVARVLGDTRRATK